MTKTLFKLLILACFTLALPLWGDEIVIVKAVSASKKTFVLAKGVSDGVHVGQKRAFTTDKISLIARVVEAKHDMSLWQIDEPNAIIPFKREDVVVLTNTTESIWTDIARLEKDYKIIKEKKYRSELERSSYIARGSLSKGLSESTSETSGDQETSRNGFQIEGLYTKSFGWEIMDWGLGLRYDRDAITVTSNSNFTILNTRLMLIADLQYNLDPLPSLGGNFYTAVALGYGLSNTKIDETSTKGTATLLPCVRVGFRHDFETYHMLYELAMESLTTQEKFEDGTSQKTTLINSKFSIGVRF